MIVAKVRTTHVPMKIFGLQIEREHVGQQRPQGVRNLYNGIRTQVGRNVGRLNTARFSIVVFHLLSLVKMHHNL